MLPPKVYQQALLAERERQRTEWLKISLARPLFEPSRRPPKTSELSAGSAPKLPRLSGVMITPEERIVIFAGPDGKSVILHEGGSIYGYTVQKITPGQATVTGPDGRQVIHPSFDPNPQANANVSAVSGAQPRPLGVAGLFASPPPSPATVSAQDQSVGSPASVVNRPHFTVPLSQAGTAFPGLSSPK